MPLKIVVRKTKEDRSIRETKPVVLPVKQKESLSHMNSREFTYIYREPKYFNFELHRLILCGEDNVRDVKSVRGCDM